MKAGMTAARFKNVFVGECVCRGSVPMMYEIHLNLYFARFKLFEEPNSLSKLRPISFAGSAVSPMLVLV